MRLDPDTCYQVMLARDRRFDGWFFVGVSSTGIYCRPVCPVRTPKRENCHFFTNPAAAERAVFRPCLRCRPELAPGNGLLDVSSRLAQATAVLVAEDGQEVRAYGGCQMRQRCRGLSSAFVGEPHDHAASAAARLARDETAIGHPCELVGEARRRPAHPGLQVGLLHLALVLPEASEDLEILHGELGVCGEVARHGGCGVLRPGEEAAPQLAVRWVEERIHAVIVLT